MRSDMKISTPPPPELGEAAAERPKGKRPWSKPTLRIMDMIFTHAGFNADPDRHENLPSPSAQMGVTYRTS